MGCSWGRSADLSRLWAGVPTRLLFRGGSSCQANAMSVVAVPTATPRRNGMVMSMATQKVTVTLGVEQVESVKALVKAGDSPSVSAFVQSAVGAALDDASAWGRVLAEALEQSGGPLTPEERDWADAMLNDIDSHSVTAA